MEIYAFHLMPWPHLPADFAADKKRYPTSWVTLSNSYYDPVEGRRLYNQYLDELEYAETLGFDGVCVNEHHQNAYGTMPAPNIMAAMLARRTSRVKIAVVGNGLPLRDHPLRVAEEVAMLDVVSGGRIISGFVRGIGCEYFSLGVNPTYSMERFREAHDLIVRAWTDPGPFSWEGKHYEVRYVNVWPRPLQKPHPPIWIPGFGSRETVDWCAHPDRKYVYLAVYMPDNLVKWFFDMYRESAERYGYTASPYQLGHLLPVYVAETDARAEGEAAQHLLWLYHYGLRHKFEFLFPPGYVSHASMNNILKVAPEMDWEKMSFRELNEKGFAVIGSAATVKQRLAEYAGALGFGILPVLLHFGDMPHHKTMNNMELFASEVMPYLRNIHAKSAIAETPTACL
ncbi:MAG TPA: LLM class flavin-dependent oxidoreductase [Methylomirabilota bacterium]|jgi:alkanesulfonate monooxygenase SsuD/methylene tetrahydromethanopterin reductase-like flavin-dependent oxidoreductase (luciferase family)|nr:LLM class flavin-dependent oxidoreductase [Methylomirabilota bacterium]